MARAAPKSKKRPAPKSKKEEKKEEEEEVVDVSEEEQEPANADNGNKETNNDSGTEEDVEEDVEEEPPVKKGRGRPAGKAAKKTAPAKKGAAKGRASSSGRKAASKKDEDSEEEDEEEYEVEKILDVRKRKGAREFLIKWKGYSKAKATWEPEDNLSCDVLIKEFEEKEKERKDQPVRSLRPERKETDRYADTADLKYEGSKRKSHRIGKSPRKTYREPEDD